MQGKSIASYKVSNDRSGLTHHIASLQVRGSMPTPLQWDARRDWTFDVDLVDAKISLLRDHITLISDLAKDWSSGATGDFHHFIPCDYQFRITLTDFSIKLYLNDFNIVDSPNKAEANCEL